MSGGPILADDANEGRWVAVCSRERLSDKKIICVRVAGIGILVVQDNGQVYACERACPHEQADLGLGRVADGRLYCPRHLAWFDLENGHISPGWPSRALRRYPIRSDGERIWVDSSAVAEA